MLKVILEASKIPLESVVTKRSGEKKYTLREKLIVYSKEWKSQALLAESGTRFLVGENGDANVVPGDMELVWHADEYDVMELLEKREGEGYSDV